MCVDVAFLTCNNWNLLGAEFRFTKRPWIVQFLKQFSLLRWKRTEQ